MYKEIYTTKCKKDIKKLKKQGKNKNLLTEVVTKLVNNIPLEEKYKEHYLSNNWAGCLECHIEPDWLLIYRIDITTNVIYFLRTGSHAHIFEEYDYCDSSLKELNEILQNYLE